MKKSSFIHLFVIFFLLIIPLFFIFLFHPIKRNITEHEYTYDKGDYDIGTIYLIGLKGDRWNIRILNMTTGEIYIELWTIDTSSDSNLNMSFAIETKVNETGCITWDQRNSGIFFLDIHNRIHESGKLRIQVINTSRERIENYCCLSCCLPTLFFYSSLLLFITVRRKKKNKK